MTAAPPLLLAEVGQPLFGSPWLALGVVLLGVAALMAAIAYVGRVLADSHPSSPPAAPMAAAPAPAAKAAPEAAPAAADPLTAIIAAAVYATLGQKARILSVQPATPSVEMLMQQWSLEGRRQIYSSHQVR